MIWGLGFVLVAASVFLILQKRKGDPLAALAPLMDRCLSAESENDR